MVESIVMKNIATYPSEGVVISETRKINFFYGTNGCGKTTISNFLDDPTDHKYRDCTINWKGSTPFKTLVYNKRFRDRNFGNGKLDGVFTLGEATQEEIAEIDKLVEELKGLKSQIVIKKETLAKQETELETFIDDFKEQIWQEAYKPNEESFKEAFSGFLKKVQFRDRILVAVTDTKVPLLSREDLVTKAETIFGETPTTLPFLPELDFSRLGVIELNPIWEKKIVGKNDIGIGSLIQSLNITDWVNEGRKHIPENAKTCPFCQKDTITEEFRHELEAYFDKSFSDDMALVHNLQIEYERVSENLRNVLSRIADSEKEQKSSKLNVELFNAYSKTMTSIIQANVECLKSKAKEPSRSFVLSSTSEQLEEIRVLVGAANSLIRSHNAIVGNFETERTALIQSVWKLVSEASKTSLTTYLKKLEGRRTGIAELSKQRDEMIDQTRTLESRIAELNKNVTSIQPSIDQIDKMLKSYGFTNFTIVKSKSDPRYYTIEREDGSVAESTLSEGEITFITFLYFLQLAKGGTSEASAKEERILVIDDPISSLDSTVLFVVSSQVKQIIRDIKRGIGLVRQIFVLTHNVYFHKEASFIDGRTERSADTHFWILRKNRNQTTLQPFKMENPIENSYELLWRELKNREASSTISVQNTMRRIIENYFKLLGKYGDDDLIKSFSDPEEQTICRSLFGWINDGSHSIPDDVFIQLQHDTIEKYFQVFRQIFENTQHIEHFKMMMAEE